MIDAVSASSVKTAWSSDWAVSFWGLTITMLAALSGDAALITCCIALPLAPKSLGAVVRIGLIALAVSAFAIGSSALAFVVPAALALSGYRIVAARALFTLVALTLLAHHFEVLPPLSWMSIHPGSTGFIILPTLAATIVFGPVAGWRAVVAIFIGMVATLILVDASATQWVNHTTFTNPIFRLGAALSPLVIASRFIHPKTEEVAGYRGLFVSVIVGLVIALALPSKPVTTIMFDEAHGTWETVQAPFGPDDFGRAVNYTYSLFFRYAESVVGAASVLRSEEEKLPEQGIFVLKMPTQALSTAFADRLENWVHGGGRLMVIADHTDLYDTAQNLNAFLKPRFGIALNPDAVYDAIGMPTEPVNERFAALFGQIDADSLTFPWQTGTSLRSMPGNTVSLSTFGMSFSEPGDYSRQNRFGPFAPRTSLRFTEHLAIGAFGVGKGAVAVILDSTPWSNFSQFKEQYRTIFRALVHALEHPVVLHIWGWGALVLAGIALASIFWRNPSVMLVGGLVLGLTVGSSAQIGRGAFLEPVEGRDYGLRVVSGNAARFEILRQLVGPGERNYSRIVSAMAKYDLDPVASPTGSTSFYLSKARRWLLIEPDNQQLPEFEKLIPHLQRGGDLTIIFAPNQATDPAVRQWLGSLGLYIQKTVGLAVAEDSKQGLLNRNGALLLRDIRTVSGALTTSVLKGHEFDVLLQSYTVRPTTLPRTSGLLTLSFSADQFSDDAVGEVWDGIQPSSLGQHRERQLAAALSGKDFPEPFPENLQRPVLSPPQEISLAAYALFDNGQTVLSGRFSEPTDGLLSPSNNLVGYLADLRDRAMSFVAVSCPKQGRTTICERRLLGQDSIEWMISWAADGKGQVHTIELLHERRFSGMGSTVNVVFGQ